MMTAPTNAAAVTGPVLNSFEQAMDTERRYFEMGARLDDLPGAVLAWTPGFPAAPGAAVVHRIQPHVVCEHGPGWRAELEQRLAGHGIRLARLYLDARHPRLEAMLSKSGYVCREELLFAGCLADPAPLIELRRVAGDTDWRRKLAFHQEAPESPDGHQSSAADITGLERHKCAHGMEAFTGEADGRVIGVISAIWGLDIVRIKNVLVHPAIRRRSVATALVRHIAALGRQRGVERQCLVALKGGVGEMMYRRMGMSIVGSCFEWSKPLPRS